MTKNIEKLSIELDGIGHTLSDNTLVVPIYQRSYAWEDKHVRDLYQDILSAIRESEKEYFIGSIVISSNKGQNEVIDGQQRLATVTILFAAIRDYFFDHGDTNRVEDLQNKYLSRRNIRTQEVIPNLSLNISDHQIYLEHIIAKPRVIEQKPEAKRESHLRILKAYNIARSTINSYASISNNPTEALIDLCEFLDDRLKIIVVKVPTHANAYTIFETLNDRGLDLAISDLLKNFLLGQSDDRINEVQSNWTEMYSTLENTENEELVITFFRQYWSSIYGITRERQMYEKIKEKITSKQKAVDLSIDLAKAAKVYVSLIDINQSFWNNYSIDAKTHMASLNLFGMTQVRPLLLAIFSHFSNKETEKALRFLVSASVRFLIHGGLGGGALESQYSERAKEITSKEITTTRQLLDRMKSAIPTDIQFYDSFKTASVSKQNLARYYLIVLEKVMDGALNPELVPNSDAMAVNLEHILPKNPESSGWSIDPDKHKALVNRMGNFTILSAKLNSEIGNGSFATKKIAYKKSKFLLTRAVSKYKKWTQDEISDRQEKMAKLAVRAWPLK